MDLPKWASYSHIQGVSNCFLHQFNTPSQHFCCPCHHPSAEIMVTTSLAWARLTLAACAIRHSLVLAGSCSRHATTCTRHSVSGYHTLMQDSHLLHAGDVVLDLLDESHLVQFIATVLDVAQEHPCLADLGMFKVFNMMICHINILSLFLPEKASCPSTWTARGPQSQRRW